MTSPSDAESRPSSSFRPDIEGLRAVAVGSVLLYHAGLAWVPGGFVGVDVFFVISGFLITTLMVREVQRHGRLRLGEFWARRARRLLPASTLVLVFSGLVTVLALPVTSRKEFGGDIVAAALYVVNWRLGHREVDYLAGDVGSSPVQHYWSLAVEEQFYILWPLLITLIVVWFGARRRAALLLGILAVSVASFAWSLSYSVEQPGLAFFVSTTRLWELGVGALLAIGYPSLVRMPAAVRVALGWLGLGAIGFAAVTFDQATVWPGTATLLPVLGTAAAILAGGEGLSRRGAGRLLSLPPAVWVGGLSYSLYLWHWPFLVGAEGLWGDLRVRQTILVVLASAVPAWLSFRYVENPIRRSRRLVPARPALVMGAAGTVVAGVAGLAVIASFSLVDTVEQANAAEAPGAAILQGRSGDDLARVQPERAQVLRPTPLEANLDRPSIYRTDCVVNRAEDRYEACEFADEASDRTVVLVGDSKALQWFTPVEQIAKEQGWRLVVIAKTGCQFADVVRLVDDKPNPSCDTWSSWALAQIEEIQPDVVLTVTRWSGALSAHRAGATGADHNREAMVAGLVSHWRAVLATGARLVPILDTPGRRGGLVPECVHENPDDLHACGFDKAERLRTSGAQAQLAAAAELPDVTPVDMVDVVCPDGAFCPAVIGNVVVYRSGTHLSDTYAETATGQLSARLAKATDGLLGRPLPDQQ